MGNRSTSEEINEEQKSRKPPESPFKQQKLPAWQPIITINVMLTVLFLLCVTLIPVGIVLVITSNRVSELNIDYTDENCLSSSNRNESCSQVLDRSNKSGVTCQCQINFNLKQDFLGDVFFYYGLSNFYQNHRRYVQSRDENQLLAKNLDGSDSCEPFWKLTLSNQTKIIYPCGSIANSRFNDSFRLVYNGNENVPWMNTSIAWSTDKIYKFQNPSNFSTILNIYSRPPYWNSSIFELDPSNSENNGVKNEDFINWMRPAAMPTFKKLYRKLSLTSSNSFSKGLPSGNYSLIIDYNFPVKIFSGRKMFYLSTSSWMGGKNSFLGWSYIVVGIICFLLFVSFFILDRQWRIQFRIET